jgi:hypothetical protein
MDDLGVKSEVLTWTDSSYVGVNTTSPYSRFELLGAGGTGAPTLGSGALYLSDNEYTSAGAGASLIFGGGSNGGDGNIFAGIKGYLTNGGQNTQGNLNFFTRINGTDSTLSQVMTILSSGNVGIGTTNPGASDPIPQNGKLEVNGDIVLTNSANGGGSESIIFADGTVQHTAYTGIICGGDYAESVDVSGSRTNYEPGDVLVLDADNPGKVLKSVEAYSTAVSGIYSTKPGVVGRRQTTGAKAITTEVPMAMVGIVPAKVSAENGSIKVGDLLVSSSATGYAMKGTDRSRMFGAVIGKAMGNLNSGKGVIEVLVTLQ